MTQPSVPLELLEPGSQIWIPDQQHQWRSCTVLEKVDSGIQVELDIDEDGEDEDERTMLVKAGTKMHLRNRELLGDGALTFNDLTKVPNLHEPAVLHALQCRFKHGTIYTLTGPILLAVNPFRVVEGLYSAEKLRSFVGATKPYPHVFSIANAAFTGISERQSSQTVLISGESGAGKTETTKFVMQFLALAGAGEEKGLSRVERQVLESNPLLEAFGNAKTLRNENSSRFGKYIELQFGSDFKGAPARLVGARIRTYLLEKIRVTDQQEGERCFHSFYQALAGARRLLPGSTMHTASMPGTSSSSRPSMTNRPSLGTTGTQWPAMAGRPSFGMSGRPSLGMNGRPSTGTSPIKDSFDENEEDELDTLGLGELEVDLSGFAGYDVDYFNYLTRSSCYTLTNQDEAEEFEATLFAMRTVGFSNDEMSGMFHVLAAVLHLGNIVFVAPKNNSEGSEVVDRATGPLAVTSQLLGLDPAGLEGALCCKTMQAPGEGVIRSSLTVANAAASRDALARVLYHAVFKHIVKRTNASIGFIDQAIFCGVLDIFGFEFFGTNSLEQLCINYTNELLQQYFNQFIFENEAQLYAEEGIPFNKADFPDNTRIVEMLNTPPKGIFPMLDEECNFIGGTSSTWFRKLEKNHKSDKHDHFDIIKHKVEVFVVKHFAGPVEYNAEGFMDKNKDSLSNDLITCALESSKDCIKDMLQEKAQAQGAIGGADNRRGSAFGEGPRKRVEKVTVSSEFRKQLVELMTTIRETSPHFVRCLKPNGQNKPYILDRASITEQLRYQGVIQAIEVSRAGYPVRLQHKDFFMDFQHLAPDVSADLGSHALMTQDYISAAKDLLKHLDETILRAAAGKWAVGKTRIFLKQDATNVLSAARVTLRQKQAVRIQCAWRRYVDRSRFLKCRHGFVRLQAIVRGNAARGEVYRKRKERAALEVQTSMRTFKALRQKQHMLNCLKKMQTTVRMHQTKKRFGADRGCVMRLQRWWRSVIKRRRWRNLRENILRVQCAWRGYRARKTAKERLALLHRRQRAMWILTQRRRERIKRAKFREEAMHYYFKRQPPPVAPARSEILAKLINLEQDNDDLVQEAARLRQECLELEKHIKELKDKKWSWW